VWYHTNHLHPRAGCGIIRCGICGDQHDRLKPRRRYSSTGNDDFLTGVECAGRLIGPDLAGNEINLAKWKILSGRNPVYGLNQKACQQSMGLVQQKSLRAASVRLCWTEFLAKREARNLKKNFAQLIITKFQRIQNRSTRSVCLAAVALFLHNRARTSSPQRQKAEGDRPGSMMNPVTGQLSGAGFRPEI